LFAFMSCAWPAAAFCRSELLVSAGNPALDRSWFKRLSTCCARVPEGACATLEAELVLTEEELRDETLLARELTLELDELDRREELCDETTLERELVLTEEVLELDERIRASKSFAKLLRLDMFSDCVPTTGFELARRTVGFTFFAARRWLRRSWTRELMPACR
jgi:hypothetical protein